MVISARWSAWLNKKANNILQHSSKKQKDFVNCAGVETARPIGAKVFWFFFSKKNAYSAAWRRSRISKAACSAAASYRSRDMDRASAPVAFGVTGDGLISV
jgi:hypothetical protein